MSGGGTGAGQGRAQHTERLDVVAESGAVERRVVAGALALLLAAVAVRERRRLAGRQVSVDEDAHAAAQNDVEAARAPTSSCAPLSYCTVRYGTLYVETAHVLEFRSDRISCAEGRTCRPVRPVG